MKEDGKEKAKILGFPSERIVRTPAEIAEEKMKELDRFAQRVVVKFRETPSQSDRTVVERIKGKISGHELDYFAKWVRAIRGQYGPHYSINPVDIAIMELYLEKRTPSGLGGKPQD